MYDEKTPIGVVYIAPSVTTFGYKNPSYRIYELDANYTIVDYEQYITNLTEANELNQVNWYLEYSAKAEYNMTDLSPQSWHELTNRYYKVYLLNCRFEEDDTLFQLWYFNYLSGNGYSPCEGDCKTDLLCFLRASTYDDYIKCSLELSLWVNVHYKEQ